MDLTRIDGISAGAAAVVLTEVGPHLAAFPSEAHFVSWLRLCPLTPISGGKPPKKRRNGYRMLRYGHDYVDIGEKPYDHRFQIRRLAALTETANSLGYTLVPNVAAG